MIAENNELLNIALKAAELAQKNILKYFLKDITVELKKDATPVTIADKTTEEIIRNFFYNATPNFGIIGEEFGIENPNAEYQWIVDPIDGTKSFIHGVPLFGTLIALYKKDEPIASVVRIPALNTAVWAANGSGAFLDKVPVKCSSIKTLKDSLLLSGTINTIDTKGYSAQFTKVRHNAKLYRGWGDCYGYYMVATGRAECMIDPIVSLWDIAPYPLLFKEAQGKFSTINSCESLFDKNGKPIAPIYEGFTSVATNGNIHSEVLNLMQQKTVL